jgi:hypothetical protein
MTTTVKSPERCNRVPETSLCNRKKKVAPAPLTALAAFLAFSATVLPHRFLTVEYSVVVNLIDDGFFLSLDKVILKMHC